jgi:hypothetical protein
MPHWLLQDDDEVMVMAMVPGAEGLFPLIPREHVVSILAMDPIPAEHHTWHTNRVLRISPKGQRYSIALWWNNDTNHFHSWQIDVQEVWRPSPLGYDGCDQLLDISVAPDRTWHFKDEDQITDAVAIGALTAAEAAGIHEVGQSAAARISELVPTGWEEWRPNPAWPPLPLPDGWDRF